MPKITVLFCIIACFFVQAVYSEGQSQGRGNARPGTSTQSSANEALSNMDNTLSSMEGDFTPEDEYYLGRAVAANILSIYRPWNQNTELTRYLNRICQTIAINSPQPEMFNGYHVIILDSPEYNAFATPGGHILITRGLVGAATSEDMLAAVIAHEFAHILFKHSTGIIADMRLNDELVATANRAGGIAARESLQAARAVLLRDSASKLVDTMVRSGYSQQQEFEADTAAITLLAASGYNPEALMEMLRVLQRVQNSQRGGFGATHPSPADRIANADRMTGRYRIQDTSSYRARRFINK
jgi:predicted Zn-dependent protease